MSRLVRDPHVTPGRARAKRNARLYVCALLRRLAVSRTRSQAGFTGGGRAHVTNPQRPKDAAARPLRRKGHLISVHISSPFCTCQQNRQHCIRMSRLHTHVDCQHDFKRILKLGFTSGAFWITGLSAARLIEVTNMD